ncbi:hypothetical protein NDU88_010341 [Pleurodeles waltl]|uniref:Uncharacterized protein n=1 Tax=Pleurodeles waltl TaxID=8319 RepID=A0AAV7QW39_PLEWA|nr:hypothetical protein NDU88_010341 [Pleurodeles waltl]
MIEGTGGDLRLEGSHNARPSGDAGGRETQLAYLLIEKAARAVRRLPPSHNWQCEGFRSASGLGRKKG